MGDGAPRPHPHGRWQRVRAGPCPTEHRAAPTLCPAHHVPGAPRRWRCHLRASGGEPPNPCIVARLVQAALPASECRWLLLWPEFSSREVSRAFRWSSQSLGQRFPGPPFEGSSARGSAPQCVPTGSRAAGGAPHTLPLEGGLIGAMRAPSRACSSVRPMPSTRACPGDALPGVCRPRPRWTPLALVRGRRAGGVSTASLVTRGCCRVAEWPARPQPGAQTCHLLLGPAVGAPRGAEPAAPGTAHGPRGCLEKGTCLGRALGGRSGSSQPGPQGRSLSGRCSLDTCSRGSSCEPGQPGERSRPQAGP